MSAIEKYEGPLDLIQSIDDLARLSQSIMDSNYYKDTTSAQQVGVKLMVARELGLGINAISFIYPLKGKITIGYQILIALVKRSGKYDMRFRERTDKRCEIEWFERNHAGKFESVGFSSFTMDDAKRSGLMNNPNYTKNPVEMLVARAVSSGFNSYTPECAGGGLYSLGELDDPEPTPDPAPRRKRGQSASNPVTPPIEETVIDVEPVSTAAPDVGASVEPNDVDPVESDAAVVPTHNHASECAAVIKSMSKDDRNALKRACVEKLDIAWDARLAQSLVDRFGEAATSKTTLLAALIEAVSPIPMGEAEGEVSPAESFQEFLDNDNGDLLGKFEDRMAAAGQYGSGAAS